MCLIHIHLSVHPSKFPSLPPSDGGDSSFCCQPTQRNGGGTTRRRQASESRQKAGLARLAWPGGLSFIQTEVSRAEKIKRGKKISRIHLNLDGIIMVDDGGRREDYLDIYGAAGRGRGVEASEEEEHIFIKDLLLLRLCPKNNSVLLSILIT